MTEAVKSFSFEYHPGKILFGEGCVGDLADELERRGLERALVVCGETVGDSPAVMDPVTSSLAADDYVVFAESTPEKYLTTAVRGAERVRDDGIDVVVAVGGGSSIDVAKIVSAIASHDGEPADVAAACVERGYFTLPDDSPVLPVVAIPTTLAGADLSSVATVKLTMDPGAQSRSAIPNGSLFDPRGMPAAIFYDPGLFATTPKGVLTASAMNGFDKGLEAIYAKNSTPVTDGTAARGLRYLAAGLGTLREESMDAERLHEAVIGTILVQYGVSIPGDYKLSVIHAIGHGFSRNVECHQGEIHGIIAPHVLRYLFETADARRGLIAEALGVREDTEEATAESIVATVEELRDSLGLPSRLREIAGLRTDDLQTVTEKAVDDYLMGNAPVGIDPTAEDVLGILQRAW